jgi:hypothetical protein
MSFSTHHRKEMNMSENAMELAQALVDRVNADTVQKVAAQIEADERQRAANQARVDGLPALEQQREELHQAIGTLTNEIAAAVAKQVTLADMQGQLNALDNEILLVRKLAQ